LFTQGPSVTTRFVLLLLVSVLLMTLDHKQQHLDAVRAALSVALHPLRVAANLPFDAAHWLGESLSSRQRLQEENAALRSQHLLLQGQLQKLAALEAENRRLRELLGSAFRLPDRILIAEVYRVASDPFQHIIEINKGALSEAYPDQPVLDAYGVLGQVIRTTPLSATVRLITDPGQTLPVQVNRNGIRTLALGTGVIDRLELPYLPNNSDIRVGDLLVTSGLGGVYPAGYPVARITEVRRNPEAPFATVIASPTAHLDRSREVLLVWTTPAAGPTSPALVEGDADAAAPDREGGTP